MGEAAEELGYTYEEYLELDEESEYKLEYLNGEIYPLGWILAMGGGARKHSRLGARMIAKLESILVDRPCDVFSSDQRVRVLATGFAGYPDVSVVCGREEIDPKNKQTITNPILLVEVLSKGTELHDRNVKAEHYRQIPSLREYLFLSRKEQLIEHYVRQSDGTWTREDIRPPDKVRLAIGGEIDVADVYRKRTEGDE
jgi:Uma2 family endonuclease